MVIRGEKYDVFFDRDLRAEIDGLLAGGNVFLVADGNTAAFAGGYEGRKYVLNAGERSKTMSSIERICDAMLTGGCNRATTVLALGGGVVGDTAGFAASVFMRGVPVIQIPTTLLSQVDSSIGGKTGVNSRAAKNAIGAFYQPRAVYASAHFWQTLPERELRCGFGEIFKTALLDEAIFNGFFALTEEIRAARGKAAGVLKPHIGGTRLFDVARMCARFKLDVVTKDEREANLRKILNCGHTLGHAFEQYGGYKLSHGEYVVYGIMYEAAAAADAALIDKGHLKNILSIGRFLTRSRALNFEPEAIADICAYDKKNGADGISMILSIRPGKWCEVTYKKSELIRILRKTPELIHSA